jgi:hypothetical protein
MVEVFDDNRVDCLEELLGDSPRWQWTALAPVQGISPSFSSTSSQDDFNSCIFINIVSSQKVVKFSPFVFNNIVRLTLILWPLKKELA